jgi:hypothetical protein
MVVYWDLDGVLRLFGSYILGYEPQDWNATSEDGKSVIQIVNEHPELCLSAPESEYLPIVNERLEKIHLLTNQLPSWVPYTNRWLNEHIKIQYEVIYTKGPTEKLAMLKPNDVLVEDYPNFSSYEQVALITRAYNRGVNAPLRISNIKEFEAFLETIT